MREIGSEFWDVPARGERRFLLSGRTALEYILRDILAEHEIGSALLPSYCCHTMIEPFVRHGIPVRFYDVFSHSEKGLCAEIPESRSNEIFYYMSYFGFHGFSEVNPNALRDEFKVVIEDRTHSWLRDGGISADYSYISFRKWAGFYGIAEADKKNGSFIQLNGRVGEKYCGKRKKAMLLKEQYIKGFIGENAKESFLDGFSDAEDLLATDYIGYVPTGECMLQLANADFDFIREKRRENASILIQGLREIQGCELMFKAIESEDTPLFVPILVEPGREGLREYLIRHQIYCPAHWPLSEYHQGLTERGKSVYDKELSLVCDQRYSTEDMERMVRIIRRYLDRGD